MPYKPWKIQKTDEEWKQIRFQNSLGPQIGGLIHDAVSIVTTIMAKFEGDYTGKMFKEKVKKDIKFWLDTLYDIAEAKKRQLTESPTYGEQMEAEEKYQKKQEEEDKRIEQSKIDDLEKEAKETADMEKEIPVIEEKDTGGWEYTKDSAEKQVPFDKSKPYRLK